MWNCILHRCNRACTAFHALQGNMAGTSTSRAHCCSLQGCQLAQAFSFAVCLPSASGGFLLPAGTARNGAQTTLTMTLEPCTSLRGGSSRRRSQMGSASGEPLSEALLHQQAV